MASSKILTSWNYLPRTLVYYTSPPNSPKGKITSCNVMFWLRWLTSHPDTVTSWNILSSLYPFNNLARDGEYVHDNFLVHSGGKGD